MSLEVVVLGGSAAWPNPGQGCSSYLVRSRSTSIVVDCGPDTLHVLRQYTDYSTVDAIIITHCHADHILDLVPFRYGLTYGPQRPEGRLGLWLPPGGRKRLNMLGDAFSGQNEPYGSFWDEVFSPAEYAPDSSLSIGDLTVSFAATQHYIDCFAVRIGDAIGRSVTYTSDTGSIAPLAELVRGANVLVAEATLELHGEGPEADRGHITAEEAGQLAAAGEVDTLVLTHLWSERPAREVVDAAARHYTGTIEIAMPGLRIEA